MKQNGVIRNDERVGSCLFQNRGVGVCFTSEELESESLFLKCRMSELESRKKIFAGYTAWESFHFTRVRLSVEHGYLFSFGKIASWMGESCTVSLDFEVGRVQYIDLWTMVLKLPRSQISMELRHHAAKPQPHSIATTRKYKMWDENLPLYFFCARLRTSHVVLSRNISYSE